jgi:hypothetical protein
MATAYDTWKTYDAEGERAAERAEAIDALVDEYRKDPKKLAEAEEWTAGTFDGSHYTAVSLALHALHRIEPDKLLGSDALANLYRLAKVDHEAIEAKLREMAEDELSRLADEAEAMRSEMAAERRNAA